jgi:hypothetical protein
MQSIASRYKIRTPELMRPKEGVFETGLIAQTCCVRILGFISPEARMTSSSHLTAGVVTMLAGDEPASIQVSVMV